MRDALEDINRSKLCCYNALLDMQVTLWPCIIFYFDRVLFLLIIILEVGSMIALIKDRWQ